MFDNAVMVDELHRCNFVGRLVSNTATEPAETDQDRLRRLFEQFDEEARTKPRSSVTLDEIVEAIRADREGAH